MPRTPVHESMRPVPPSIVLGFVTDVSTLSFYKRGSVSEFLTLTVIEREAKASDRPYRRTIIILCMRYNCSGAEQLTGVLLSIPCVVIHTCLVAASSSTENIHAT